MEDKNVLSIRWMDGGLSMDEWSSINFPINRSFQNSEELGY